MSKYKMNINGIIGLADYSNIYDYVSLVNKNDDLFITVDKVDKQEVDIICNILKEQNFSIDLSESNIRRRYCIKAFKN